MLRSRHALLVALFLGLGMLGGCSPGSDVDDGASVAPLDTIAPQTKADSVAHRMLQAHGANAWATAPYLRFNFGIETPEGTQVIARHLWNRNTGEYRVEWSAAPDSAYVALVNIRDVSEGLPSGQAYLNGEALTGAEAEKVRKQAYGRFVNDTYWLLAPLKAYDPGVQRTFVADSSTAKHDVIYLSFGDVGLTPGDQYWLYVLKETGRLDQWAYHLQGMSDDAEPRHYKWTDYQRLSAPGGPVHLAARKKAVGAEQALLTNQLALPESPPSGAFESPDPILGTAESPQR